MNGYMMIGIVIMIIVLSIGMSIIKRNLFQSLYLSLNNENYEYFFNKVDSHIARALLPIYTREIMRLNAYMKTKEAQTVTEQFNKMMKMHLNQYQLVDLLTKAFSYYAINKDQKKCARIIKKMEETMDDAQCQKYRMYYEIVFEASIKYLEEIKQSLLIHRGKKRGYFEYLLAKSYLSKHDKESYEKYIQLAAEDYKTNVEQLETRIQIM
ncbi:MAG: hypothetical protein RR558_03550 [Coprobacillus sp.]